MNTVEALKELYKSFGGKLTDTYSDIADGIPVGNYTVIPDCFAALAEIAGGSIELPVVTQADAGDVLTVNAEGKWANAEPAKELPSVTADDNGSLLRAIGGTWTNFGNYYSYVNEYSVANHKIEIPMNIITGILNNNYTRKIIIPLSLIISSTQMSIFLNIGGTATNIISITPKSTNLSILLEIEKISSTTVLIKMEDSAVVATNSDFAGSMFSISGTGMGDITSGNAIVYYK